MNSERQRWEPTGEIRSPHLRGLLAAWRNWAGNCGIPRRSSFDPFEFPPLLPLMILAEIVPEPNPSRPYDVLYRYIGTEFSTFFDSGKVTRARLSEIGAPFDERWFAVSDAAIAARMPCFFDGNPLGTEFAHVALEMLALPLAAANPPVAAREGTAGPGADGDKVAFLLCALARRPGEF